MTHPNQIRKAETAVRVFEAYALQPGVWLAARAVAAVAGVTAPIVSKRAADLVAHGKLEHNGMTGPWVRYRAPAGPGTIVPLDAPQHRAERHNVRGAKTRLSDDERRRLEIEEKVLVACADAPMRARGVAVTLVRNLLEVQGIMLDLCHRGLLRSRDGYRTFETQRAATVRDASELAAVGRCRS